MSGAVTSRANLVRKAVRPAMPARLMLSAPAGAGKTWTALTIARTLVGPDGEIIVIDTEEESALTYADEHDFEHLPWEPPYDPRQLAATVADLSTDRNRCIIIDSESHFWMGEGGTLEIANGKFTGWKDATPAQDEMVLSMLRSKSHIIACVREKQAYAVSENSSGKQVVEKLGLQPVQREGLDYEFNVAVSMDMGHTITVHKTRCRRLADRVYRPNHAEDLAEQYLEWLNGGHPVIDPEDAKAVVKRVLELPNDEINGHPGLRHQCIAEIKDRFGKTEHTLVEDIPELHALVHSFEVKAGIVAEGPEEPQPDPNFEDDTPAEPVENDVAAVLIDVAEQQEALDAVVADLLELGVPFPDDATVEELQTLRDSFTPAVEEAKPKRAAKK